MESNWKFQRGDIYFVKLEAGVGSEQNGARPAVILQNDVGNIYSPTLIVAALTSKTDKKVTQATHCQVEEDGLKPSIVQAEQIFTIDKSRVLKFVGHLSPENMRRVDDAVKISLFSFSKEPNPEAFERIRNILLATSYTKKVG